MFDDYGDEGDVARAAGAKVQAGGKRPREDAQHKMIMSTMKAVDEVKQDRKEKKGKALAKGKTLQEIEEEEGGPVKESLLSVAQAKRAAARKKKALDADDTEMPGDGELELYEEELEAEEEEEGGVKMMAFNLKEEREIGSFDEEGNFVEKREGREDRDAWLESTEVVNEKVKQLIEGRRKAAEEADAEDRRRAAAPMSDRQLALLKAQVSEHMLPGETVTRALKRIRGSDPGADGGAGAGRKVLGKREKLRLQQQQQQGGGERKKTDPPAQQQQSEAGPSGSSSAGGLDLFIRLTEAVDELFAEGETDVYSCTKEDMDKAAALWLPKPQAAAAAGGAAAGGPAAAAAAAADEDDDMFGDGFTEAPAEAGQGAGAAEAGSGGGEGAAAAPHVSAPASAAGAAPGPRTDFSSWPTKELLRFLREAGADAAGALDKSELLALARGAEERQLAATAAAAVPPGYELDASSGYWFSSGTGLYYDAGSGLYYDGARWLMRDGGSGEMVEVAAQV